MKKITLLIFFLIYGIAVFAQTDTTISRCGTPIMTLEEMQKMPHYGNNNVLLDVLRKNDFEVPDDYFSLDLEQRELIQAQNIERKMQDDIERDATGIAERRSPPYYVPLKIWIYQNENGTQSAITEREVDDLIAGANRFYWQNGIPIILYKMCNVTFIRNEQYFNPADLHILADVALQQMFDAHKNANAINVHFINRSANAGRAAMIPSLACYVATQSSDGVPFDNLWLRNTLVHELGHCMGLPHTHDCNGVYGAITTTTNASLACTVCVQETVSRSELSFIGCGLAPILTKRCEVFGDLLCDTEASPRLSFSNVRLGDCQWNGQVEQGLFGPYIAELDHDFLGVRWRPQANNIMSYATDACITRFTLGQIGVILNTISNDISYFFVRNTPPSAVNVAGPRTLCTGNIGSYTVQSNPASSYIWDFVQNNPAGELFATQSNANSNGALIAAPNFITASRSITAFVTPNCCNCAATIFNVVTPSARMSLYGQNRAIRHNNYTYATNFIAGANYAWSLPNGWYITDGANTNSIEVYLDDDAISGTVGVVASGSSACGANAAWKSVIVGTSGPARLRPDLTSELKVYPNPTNGFVRIDFPLDFGISKVRFIRLADYVTLEEHTASSSHNLDISNFPAGNYMIEIQNSAEVRTFKLLKVNQ
jgi:hypothetical protein